MTVRTSLQPVIWFLFQRVYILAFLWLNHCMSGPRSPRARLFLLNYYYPLLVHEISTVYSFPFVIQITWLVIWDENIVSYKWWYDWVLFQECKHFLVSWTTGARWFSWVCAWNCVCTREHTCIVHCILQGKPPQNSSDGCHINGIIVRSTQFFSPHSLLQRLRNLQNFWQFCLHRACLWECYPKFLDVPENKGKTF